MHLPIRWRLALFSGGLTAGVVVALGSFVYLRLEADLRGSVDDGLAERTAALMADPPAGSTIIAAASDIGDVFALIVAPDGRVVAATENLPTAAILTHLSPAAATTRTYEFAIPSDDEPQAVRLMATPAPDGRTYVAGVAFDDQRATLDSLQLQLVIAIPVAVALALLTGWLVGGAALRPVERMRRETDAISASEPDRRLSVPATGDELAALAASLNRMLERLEVALDRERRVVDNASHELRTPLANLKAELDLALGQPRTDTELRAAIGSAADETDRLIRLAADLLVLARANQGRLPIKLRDVEVGHLVETTVEAFGGRASAAGVRIEAVEPRLIAKLDELRVRQALDNLIDNAIRHAGNGGTVLVVAASEGAWTRMSVSDSGPGFPPEFLAHAFEPFSRSDAGRARDDGGAGLGLAIARAVAEAHGGTVSAANRPEGGALVELRFPA